MRLSELADTSRDVEIAGLTADSRMVRRGFLFAALSGAKADGSGYIADAIRNGAAAILVRTGTALPGDVTAEIAVIEDDNPRLRLADMAGRFYRQQPPVIAAVTGTSGKTSTVNFTQQLWKLYGIEQCASLGTLGLFAPGMARPGSLTTPDTVSLMAELADLAASGVTHLAMEASSHGLDQHRLASVRVTAAGYTNLSRDHLDYHADMDSYFAAKAKLFSDVLTRKGTAVLNADDERFDALSALCLSRGQKVTSYGVEGADIRILARELLPGGQRLTLRVGGHEITVTLPLVGDFQVMNALCALGLVLAGDGDPLAITPLLAGLEGVPGRLQLVSGHPKGAAVYIDYAHKPAAVEAVLNALRPHTDGKLSIVLGCGGNRDAGKRPIMARIASGLADLVVITDDNPRNEDAAAIRKAMREGAPDATEIPGRRAAIRWAVEQLGPGDVLVIAGKGHEQGQIIGDVVEPFDDAAEARDAIKNLKVEA